MADLEKQIDAVLAGTAVEAAKPLTPKRAKDIIKQALLERGLAFAKLTAKTIGFQDLLRTDAIFVTVHGWQPNPVAAEIKSVAVQHGFRVQFEM